MMLEKKTTEFLDDLSSSKPFPGGGGASAAVGAFASALGLMVANLTVGKKRYVEVEEEIKEIREKLIDLQNIEQDVSIYMILLANELVKNEVGFEEELIKYYKL